MDGWDCEGLQIPYTGRHVQEADCGETDFKQSRLLKDGAAILKWEAVILQRITNPPSRPGKPRSQHATHGPSHAADSYLHSRVAENAQPRSPRTPR